MIPVTLLSSLLYCKRKVFLQRILKFTEPPKESLVFGKVRHESFDSFTKAEKEITLSITSKHSNSEIKDLYLKNFSKTLKKSIKKNEKQIALFNLSKLDIFKSIWPSIKAESDLRSENLLNFITSKKVYGNELWEQLFPKIESEFYISSEQLGLRGVIDHLQIHSNTKMVPFELKSGSPPTSGVWPSHRVQIGAYIMLLQEECKNSFNEGVVRYLNSADDRKIILNPFLKSEILLLRDQAEELLKSNSIPDYCQNKSKCLSCGLKEACYSKELVQERTALQINQ